MADLVAGEPDAGLEARLQLDGLGTPIVTRVTRKSARGMTVEQTLPFLRLDTLVRDDTAQPSRIASVSMVVYDGVPRLVLDLAYDEEGFVVGDPEATPRRAHPGVVRTRRETTAPYACEPEQERALQSALLEAAAGGTATVLAQSDEPAGRESTQLFNTPEAVPLEPAHTPVDLTLEQELLRSRTLKYRLNEHWQALPEPLRKAGEHAVRGALRGYRWTKPRALHAVVRLSSWARREGGRLVERLRARANTGARRPKAGRAAAPEPMSGHPRRAEAHSSEMTPP